MCADQVQGNLAVDFPARPSSSYFEIMWVDLSHDIVLSWDLFGFLLLTDLLAKVSLPDWN